MIRKARVSGLFYQSNEDSLKEEIKNYFEDKIDNDNDIIAGIVPHAGYMYSGKTASYVFNEISKNKLPETFIIIGPNHTGYGYNIDLCDFQKWETPLGLIDLDLEFIEELAENDEDINVENSAHIKEHSIEVEVPFIQYISQKKPVKIVPIVISQQIPDLCIKLAHKIYEIKEKLNRDIVVIASSDLTHYEDSDTAKFFDTKIMNSLKNMDISELINNIKEYDITMCGYGPVITALQYAKLSDYNTCKVLKYSNSGDISGDYDSVVGYTSAIITK